MCSSSRNRFHLHDDRAIKDHIRQCHIEVFEQSRQRKKRRKITSSLQYSTARDILSPQPTDQSSLLNVTPFDMGESLRAADHGHDPSAFDDNNLWEPQDFSAVNNSDDYSLDPPQDFAAASNSDYNSLHPLLSPSGLVSCGRPLSREFFFHDQKDNGMKYLAARAQFGFPDIDPDLLDPQEVKMLLQTAELATSLPLQDRQRLARFTNTVVEVVKKQTLEHVEVKAKRKRRRKWILSPIISEKQMRRQMKDGSLDSMMETVPRPEVLNIGVHAVSLPSDCLQDLAGHGFPLEYVPSAAEARELPKFPVAGVKSSDMCRKLFDVDVQDPSVTIVADYNVWIFLWSDDFEPNSSLTKSNRGGVWVKTMTIGPPDTHRHLMAYTYPIAMGPKNSNHEEAEELLSADFKRLASPEGVVVYSKVRGGFVRIRGKVIVKLMDQPERRGFNSLSGGSSDFHRRFGYSFPWQDFGAVLRPCDSCREVLFDLETPWVCPDCQDCTNFAHDPDHPLLKYPHVMDEGLKAGVLKLSYPMLCEAVELAHEGFVSGLWSTADVQEWLKMHCIMKKAADAILLHADKCKEYQDVMDDENSSDVLKDAVEEEKGRSPHLYSIWPFPNVWRCGVHLEQHPDIPMHLLCLGVVKTLLRRIDRWMAKKKKGAPFAKKMKGFLESLQELNLAWCPILPWKEGGKFGGWVSENYLTISRLLQWFYSVLDEIAVDEQPWSEPVGEMPDWTGDDCRKWLKRRGLVQTGNAADVRLRVGTFRQMPLAEQPPVVEQPGGPVETVQATVIALDRLMAWLMVEQIDDEAYYVELERKIRVFLTTFADMEAKLAKKNSFPAWLSSYNFLSLLNLPSIVRLYGPVKNIWEGSWVGEGFLRFIKPQMIHGLRKNWEKTTMKTLMRMKGMQVLTRGLNPTDGEGDGEKESKSKLFHIYRSVVEADDLLRKTDKVISAVVLDGCLGLVCKEFSVPRFVPLSRQDLHSVKMGHHYFYFERGDREDGHGPYQLLVANQIVEYCIMLPLIQLLPFEDESFVSGVYAVIDRSHRYMDAEGNLRR